MSERPRKRKSRWDTGDEVGATAVPRPEAASVPEVPVLTAVTVAAALPAPPATKEEEEEVTDMGMRSIECYTRESFIEQGSYGMVFKARCKYSNKVYAIKQIKMEDSSSPFPITALREANILLSLKHPNVVQVREMLYGSTPDKFFMAMEMADRDLSKCIKAKTFSSASEVKSLTRQLLSAVAFLHEHWIMHRDIKPSNLLYSSGGVLKLCDFGMARKYGSPLKTFTKEVVTLWYRAPEILLGQRHYSECVDNWSVGCILAELQRGRPMFAGQGEADQVHETFKVLGKPSEDSWPGVGALSNTSLLSWRLPSDSTLRAFFPSTAFTALPGAALSNSGFKLLEGLLRPCPDRRLTAQEALDGAWFKEHPPPAPPADMPK